MDIKMIKTREELKQKAEKEILEILADDDKWNFFVEVMKAKRGDLTKLFMREGAKNPGPDRAILTFFYQQDILEHTCDSCEYNFKWRSGIRKYSKKRIFNCTWEKTKGDVLARQTAREEGFGGASYNFSNPKWTAKYEKLAKIILEQHTDKTKPPQWLDEKRNYCPHHYVDLTKP